MTHMYECCGYCWTFLCLDRLSPLCISKAAGAKGLAISGGREAASSTEGDGVQLARLTADWWLCWSEDQADTGRSLYYGPIKRAEVSNWYCNYITGKEAYQPKTFNKSHIKIRRLTVRLSSETVGQQLSWAQQLLWFMRFVYLCFRRLD